MKTIINNNKDYAFDIIWNVHMYNHKLIYTDSEETVELIIEDSAKVKNEILIWELDFSENSEKRNIIIDRFKIWAEVNNIKYKLIVNAKRI